MHNEKNTWNISWKSLMVFSGIISGFLLLFHCFFIPENHKNIVTVVINSEIHDSINSREREFIRLCLNKLQVRYRIIYKPFIELMYYVKKNNNTIGIGLISKNSSREQIFTLSIPYEYSTIGLMCRSNYKPQQYITIGAQSKTTLIDILNHNLTMIQQSMKIKNYDKLFADQFHTLLTNLLNNKIDAIICDEQMFINHPYKNSFSFMKLKKDDKVYKEPIVIIYNNVNRKIIDSINEYIRNKIY